MDVSSIGVEEHMAWCHFLLPSHMHDFVQEDSLFEECMDEIAVIDVKEIIKDKGH